MTMTATTTTANGETTQAAEQPKQQAAPRETRRDGEVLDSLLNQPLKYRMALEPTTFDEGWRVAQIVARLGLCGVKSPDDGYARIMLGRAIGLPAMASIQGIAIIETKNGPMPCMYAKLKVALCLSRKDVVEFIREIEETDKKAIWEMKRRDSTKVERYEFNEDMARKAGYFGRGIKEGEKSSNNYDLHPGSMYCWRSAGRLVDRVAGDLLNGIATREDIEDGNLAEADTARLDDAPPPQAAPQRDFASEAQELQDHIASCPPEGRKAIRARVGKFLEDAPEFVGASVKEFYNFESAKWKQQTQTAAPVAPELFGK